MAKDYAAISKKIVENIGGVENIASVTHCMTRLRFVVKDEGKINDAAVKATDGVMGVVNQGGQYQIIIGNHVEEAYNEVLKMGDFGEASQVARGEKKEPLTLKKVGNNILDAIVGTMSPLIPAIIGGSMVKLLVMLLGLLQSCSSIFGGGVSNIVASSYLSEDSDLLAAETAYCAMEDELREYLDTYEQTHDYDEYHFDLDEIKHDPYVLLSLSLIHI